MEHFYLKGFTCSREWCTEKVKIRPYLQKLNSDLQFLNDKKGTLAEVDILNHLIPKSKEFSIDQLGELFESVKPAHLTFCSDDLIKLEAEEKPSRARATHDLQLLKHVCIPKKRGKMDRIKQERNRFNKKEIVVDAAKKRGLKDLHPRKNILVFFRIYEPFMHDKGAGSRPGFCTQEIAVLGHQTLSDLRDKIICESDFQDILGDASNNPGVPVRERAVEVYQSSMFYIDNTFYIDSRIKHNADYSTVIKEWGESRKLWFGETKAMQQTPVQDLEVRFGYPYVFMHQGSCEHLLVCRDARLLNDSDSCYTMDYPLVKKISLPVLMYCMLCSNRIARWIVRDCDRLAHDPTYECKKCFKEMHYVGPKKIGHFKAYHFWQRSILV